MNRKRLEPLDRWAFERLLWQQGLMWIAGVDEVGRGPLAGPVVAAAAILPAAWETRGLPPELDGLNDSKQLTVAKREQYFEFLAVCEVVHYAIAVIDHLIIDEINILQATHRAMNQALAQLKQSPQHVLVDGNHVKSIPFPQTAIVKGDSLSYSIAAASVLAKVTRDRMMIEFDRQWPAYGFAEHKGYPTPAHLANLRTHGPCEIHRRSFAPVGAPVQEMLI